MSGQLRQLQLDVGILPSPQQQPTGIMTQLWRDFGKGNQAQRGVVQAHLQDCEGTLHG